MKITININLNYNKIKKIQLPKNYKINRIFVLKIKKKIDNFTK